jgi:hypothetical protein
MAVLMPQFTGQIHERPAAISRVDRRVGLDESVNVPAWSQWSDPGPKPRGSHVFRTQRIADGDNGFSNHDIRRIA